MTETEIKLPIAKVEAVRRLLRRLGWRVREEFEVTTSDTTSMIRLLEALGYHVAWRYEKYRTQFKRPGAKGMILLDETPIGTFLELEGDPGWIDSTASQLGFEPDDYITASYRALFLKRNRRTARKDMVFPAKTRNERH